MGYSVAILHLHNHEDVSKVFVMTHGCSPQAALLVRKFNVLVVDDDPEQTDILAGFLTEHPLVNPVETHTLAEACSLLEGNTRWHGCIMDLGMGAGGDDDLGLVREYGDFVPVYVYTGRSDMAKGFSSAKLGARGIIVKCSHDPPLSESLKNVYRDVMCGAVNPLRFSRSCPPRLVEATEVLCRHMPRTVVEWQDCLSFSRQHLWNLWDKYLGVDPRAALKWYRILCGAFSSIYGKGETLPWYRGPFTAEELAGIEDTFWLNRGTIEKLAFSRVHADTLRAGQRPSS